MRVIINPNPYLSERNPAGAIRYSMHKHGGASLWERLTCALIRLLAARKSLP